MLHPHQSGPKPALAIPAGLAELVGADRGDKALASLAEGSSGLREEGQAVSAHGLAATLDQLAAALQDPLRELRGTAATHGNRISEPSLNVLRLGQPQNVQHDLCGGDAVG